MHPSPVHLHLNNVKALSRHTHLPCTITYPPRALLHFPHIPMYAHAPSHTLLGLATFPSHSCAPPFIFVNGSFLYLPQFLVHHHAPSPVLMQPCNPHHTILAPCPHSHTFPEPCCTFLALLWISLHPLLPGSSYISVCRQAYR